MIVTTAQYIKDSRYEVNISIKATIDNEILVIPIAAGNRHYDAVQKWVAEGNTIKAAD